jgi:hypothetical protein
MYCPIGNPYSAAPARSSSLFLRGYETDAMELSKDPLPHMQMIPRLGFLSDEHFDSLTLSGENFTTAAFVFTAINLLVCVGLRKFVTQTKKLAWGLSLVNSFVMSIMGLVYIYQKLPLIHMALETGTGGEALLHSVDNVSALVCLWFGIVNVMDLIFGVLCYPQHLGFMTAVVHHPFYVWVMVVAVTGRGVFIKMSPFASGFMFASIEEIPTFLLALGSIFPSLRTDMGFGFSFFLLRICYNFALISCTVVLGLPLASTVIPSLSLAMHVYWFYAWWCKYGYRLVPDLPKVP